jgi:hypothetical protein
MSLISLTKFVTLGQQTKKNIKRKNEGQINIVRRDLVTKKK